MFSYTNIFTKHSTLDFKVCRINQQPATTATKTTSTKGWPDSKMRLAPAKTKRGVQMDVHKRKISKFIGLYNTGKPSNSGLGLCSPDVECN